MNHVLVTGASAGIGTAFARLLAAQKQNLILVARREDRLRALATELASQYGIDAQIVAADLATMDGVAVVVDAVSERGWQLSGLINNAGFGDRGDFTELTLQRQLDMIQVNVTSLVALTHQLLPNLHKQSGSFIINVASTAAFQAGPKMAIYYASKAFVLSFTEALHEELKGKVKVSALCPGATASEFEAVAHLQGTLLFKAGSASAESVVAKSLAHRNCAIVIPGARNVIMVWLGKLSPRFLTRRIAGRLQK